jgi:glycerol-3-phosphate dehydrogenase
LAESVEDVLARRTRALFLDAHAAIEAAESVARFIAVERNLDATWEASSIESFLAIAKHYTLADQ